MCLRDNIILFIFFVEEISKKKKKINFLNLIF